MGFERGRTANVGAGTILALVTMGVAPAYAADIVLDAVNGTRVGAFTVVNDAAASNGTAVTLANQSRTKVLTAVASPADYMELTFTAEAQTPYHLWVRMRASGNTYANDSIHVQFTNVAAAAIGTTASYVVNLEDASGAGVSGYGWQDNGYGTGVLGPDIVFAQGGTQRLRIQNREDGFVIDEVVLSSTTYLRTSPGALKNDTTMLTPPPSLTRVIRVPAGGDLQAALNGARPGDTVALSAGARYVGNIELPPNDGPEYITITSDANVPAAGTRVATSLIDKLAIIQSPDGWPAVRARIGANYYRFVGVVFRGVEGVASGLETTRDIVSVGDGTETDAALLPSHFEFDRVIIRGDATYGAKRGILGNGHDITVKNSDIRNIFRNGQDTTTFGCFNCGRGYLLQNNWLEAGSEVVIFGGAVSAARTVARDIVIQDNVLTRPLGWKALAGTTYNVKNLLELKEGINVAVRRNFMEFNWPPSQPGYAIVITAKDSKKIQNVLFEDNVVKSTAGGINMLGWDYRTVLLAPTSDVTVRNNLFVISKRDYGGNGFFLQIGSAPRNIKFDHNTIIHDGTTLVLAYTGTYLTADGVKHTDGTIDGFVWTNNLSVNGTYGFNSYGGMNGVNLLNAFPGITMHDNVIAGYTGSRYPVPNYYPPVSTFQSYFADFAGGDYRVLETAPLGSDGKRVGADVSRLPSRR
ncbi:MAG: hypothetical protein M3545_17970 [Acidobacteriota bacterium]|nr:hypothetical protein [Acidobacteriota bacterium]